VVLTGWLVVGLAGGAVVGVLARADVFEGKVVTGELSRGDSGVEVEGEDPLLTGRGTVAGGIRTGA
jgi:hypothetical protein